MARTGRDAPRAGAASTPTAGGGVTGRATAQDPAAGDAPAPRRYARIYAVVRQIPPGRVATYGQVAAIEGNSTARMVGYAMAALRDDSVPWQRVINSAGRVSERRGGGGTAAQRERLLAEGVCFDRRGRVDFARFGWAGPDWEWLERHGYYPASAPT